MTEPTQYGPPRAEFRYSTLWMIWFPILLAVMGAAALGFAGLAITKGALADKVGLPVVIFLVICAIAAAGFSISFFRAILDKTVLLRIGPDGIHMTSVTGKPVPWLDVQEIRIAQARRRSNNRKPGSLTVRVASTAPYSPSFWTRTFAWLTSGLYGGQIAMGHDYLDGSEEEIIAAIQAFSPQAPLFLLRSRNFTWEQLGPSRAGSILSSDATA
jgi:hypothetical protein